MFRVLHLRSSRNVAEEKMGVYLDLPVGRPKMKFRKMSYIGPHCPRCKLFSERTKVSAVSRSVTLRLSRICGVNTPPSRSSNHRDHPGVHLKWLERGCRGEANAWH